MLIEGVLQGLSGICMYNYLVNKSREVMDQLLSNMSSVTKITLQHPLFQGVDRS